MKKGLLGLLTVLGLAVASPVLAQAPTDNAYQTFLDSRNLGREVPHWTDSLNWSRTYDIQAYRSFATRVLVGADSLTNWIPAVQRAQQDAVAQGGGVIYFPRLPRRTTPGFEGFDSSYYFAGDLSVQSRIILRGDNPHPDSSNAKLRTFSPPTYFTFPRFDYDAGVGRPGGTPNSTAFKSIVPANGSVNNVAIVNIDINRGGIYFQPDYVAFPLPAGSTQHAVRGMYNILVLGVRNNNVVEPSPQVPTGNIRNWMRWHYRFSANFNLMVDRNAIVANCRVNDLTNNDNPNRLVEPDDFQQNGYEPNNSASPLPGSQAVFRYTDHYGVVINRLKRPTRFAAPAGFETFATEATEPSLFAPGVRVHDNWIFKTQRVGIHVGGRGLQVLRNIVTDDSSKVSYLDPTGTSSVNPQNPIVTFENRGIDFNGWDARVLDNDISVYRTLLPPLSSIARSADGEGFYSQGQGGVNPRNVIVARNTVRTSLVGLQNAVQGATKKGVNGLTLVSEVQNVTIVNNKVNGMPIHLDASTGTLSNVRIDSNDNVIQILTIGNNGGLQSFVTNNNGFTGTLPNGQTLQRTITRNCHVSLNPNVSQSTVNTNPNLTPNACSPVTNPFTCLTPAPVAGLVVPRADTLVDAALTTLRLFADFTTSTIGGCNVQSVTFYRDNVSLGQGIQESATRWSIDITLTGTGSSNYYSAKGDLNDGVTSFILETPASRIAQIVVGLDDKLALQPVKVYPNPSTGRITVKAFGGENGYAVRVLDAVGRTVHTGTTLAEETELSLAHLAKGIYTLVVSSGTQKQVTKVAIQ